MKHFYINHKPNGNETNSTCLKWISIFICGLKEIESYLFMYLTLEKRGNWEKEENIAD